jgi:hypothetical protein
MAGFDRDATVAAIRDYYHFLTKMYLDGDRIMEPPPGGWPDITPEIMRPLKKSDAVVDLLRHLPYINDSGTRNDQRVHMVPYGPSAVWPDMARDLVSGIEPATVLFCTDGDGGSGNIWPGGIPSGCAGLTDTSSNDEDNDVILLLDTERDCIWWMECPTEVEHEGVWELVTVEEERGDANTPVVVEDVALDDPDDQVRSDDEDNDSCPFEEESPLTSDDETGSFHDDAEDGEDSQGSDEERDNHEEDQSPQWIKDEYCPSWDVTEFFDKLKRHFRQLDFVPISPTEVIEGWEPRSEELVEELKPIYRKHGWPDLEVYRKEECLAEVKKAVHRIDPDRFQDENDSD